jgi:hypothetical protein
MRIKTIPHSNQAHRLDGLGDFGAGGLGLMGVFSIKVFI